MINQINPIKYRNQVLVTNGIPRGSTFGWDTRFVSESIPQGTTTSTIKSTNLYKNLKPKKDKTGHRTNKTSIKIRLAVSHDFYSSIVLFVKSEKNFATDGQSIIIYWEYRKSP